MKITCSEVGEQIIRQRMGKEDFIILGFKTNVVLVTKEHGELVCRLYLR